MLFIRKIYSLDIGTKSYKVEVIKMISYDNNNNIKVKVLWENYINISTTVYI